MNHNGAFSWNAPQLPVESAVWQSIVKSQLAHPTGVIHVGFSFYPYQGLPHPMWVNLLAALTPQVVVAPAGNQGAT